MPPAVLASSPSQTSISPPTLVPSKILYPPPNLSVCLSLSISNTPSLFVCHEHKPTQLGGKLIDDYLALLRCFADSPFFSIAPLLATTYSFISLTHPPHHLPASPLSTVSTPPAPTLPSVHCHS